MKKAFSTWRRSLLAAFACVGFGAAAVWGAQPYVIGWGMDSDHQDYPTDPAVVCGGASAIAAGYYHSLAVVDSCVYAWGANGDEGRCNVPTAGRTNVVAVAAGREFSVALRNDGTLAAWGISSVVSKLVGDYSSDVAQISAGGEHVLVLKKGGKVLATGFNSYAPECTVPDEALSDVVQVAAGEHFSFALKRDHTIVAWGNAAEDSGGVLAVPESLQGHAMAIAAGHYHALAITDTGDVVEWGWTEGHVIPDGARSGASAIAAGYDFSMAIASGKVYVWGDNDCGQQEPPASLEAGASQIVAGWGHCLALGAGMAPRWLEDSVPGDAYVARAYSGSVSATGMPEVVYGKVGTWPSWLKIDSRTGILSGTPTATSRVEHVSVVASNVYGVDSRTFDIQVFDTPVDPPEFITKGIPDAEVGLYYSFRIQAANSPLFYAIDTGSYPLPAGLELAEDGTLSGTPTTEYDSIFYVMASNITAAVTTNYLMHVGAPSEAPVILTGNPLPDAMLGEPWSVQIETDREATFAIVAGTFPSGLDIEPATGVISGTPAESGTFAFTVEAANSFGATTANFDLAVNAVPAITTETLASGSLGKAYTHTIAATGWPVPAFALASGSLPGGLTLGANGVISGTPTTAGTFTFGATASNTVGNDTHNFSITIDSVQRPQFTSMTFIASNKTVKLEWTTPVTTNTYLYWSTNIAATNATWKSLGRKKSGATIAQTNSTPIYYRLRIP